MNPHFCFQHSITTFSNFGKKTILLRCQRTEQNDFGTVYLFNQQVFNLSYVCHNNLPKVRRSWSGIPLSLLVASRNGSVRIFLLSQGLLVVGALEGLVDGSPGALGDNVCVESVDCRGAEVYNLHHTFRARVPARSRTCPRGIGYDLVVSVCRVENQQGRTIGIHQD